MASCSSSLMMIMISFFVFVASTMAFPLIPDILKNPLTSFPVPSKAPSPASKYKQPFRVGFYKSTCPEAEYIVAKVVNRAISRDAGIAPGLVRMHFHDCFVRGCDGSVLLKGTLGQPAERDHPANNPSLRGFEVIDEAKAMLEDLCPETVSCADILAFAARDSAKRAGNIWYDVKSGRRDGRVSSFNEVPQNLPPPFFNADQLIANFKRKGMSVDEMVTLSGAHSFGVSHCSSFSSRLYSFNATTPQDPSLDPAYASGLKNRCPASGPIDPTVAMERVTPNRLDNKYYSEVRMNRGLLTSDQTLLTNKKTSNMVKNNARYGSTWGAKFGKAMVHMGSLDLLTGNKGEIRRICSVVN